MSDTAGNEGSFRGLTRGASSRFRAEELRTVLAIIVLAVGLRMGLGLFFEPEEPFVLMSGMGG